MSTVHGIEDELAAEIAELAQDLNVSLKEPPQAVSAGVYVRGPWTFAIAMNLGLRCASRVLCEVLRCEVHSLDDVYDQVEALNWRSFFSLDKTFSVTANASESPIKAPSLTLKVKDALADSFRRITGERPSVEKDAPDVRVMVRLHRRTLSVSLDTTGRPLALRGYRMAGGDAPLSEVLAAGLVRMTGWHQLCREIRAKQPQKVYFQRVVSESEQSARRIPSEILLAPELIDPMCGTGTFAIEAALFMLNRRPQVERQLFSFQSLEIFPKTAHAQFESIRRQIRAQEVSLLDAFEYLQKYRVQVLGGQEAAGNPEPPILCRDRDSDSLRSAKKNAEAAGVSKLIRFEAGHVEDVSAHSPAGLVVINPPYGVRLGEEEQLKPLYKTMGDTLKKNFRGWQAWILIGQPGLVSSVGLRATRRKKVFNGGLECAWLQYVLF